MQIKFILLFYMILFPFIGGFADASSFLISGVFTGHLTGNFVLSTVYGVNQNYYLLGHTIIAIIGFICGTMLGVWFRINKEKQFFYKTSIALCFQLIVFIFVFVINIYFYNNISHVIFFGGLSFALGLQNGTINNLNKIGIHSSYVTGMSTSLINNYFTLQKKDSSYSQKSTLYKTQFSFILAFVMGALMGVVCIHFMQFIGFAILGLLLLVSIILSIYLRYHKLI